jgi:hypothetical protein
MQGGCAAGSRGVRTKNGMGKVEEEFGRRRVESGIKDMKERKG